MTSRSVCFVTYNRIKSLTESEEIRDKSVSHKYLLTNAVGVKQLGGSGVITENIYNILTLPWVGLLIGGGRWCYNRKYL